MYELRQLKQLIYERKKFMKQYESMQLEKEKTTEADILEDEEVLSSLFGDDGEFNNEDTSMYFDDHIMNDIKVISNTNVNASPERKVLDVVSNMEPSNDSLFAQKLALFDKRIAEISGEIRRLFKRGVTLNKYHSASWVAWANFEQTSGNYGE